MSQQLMHQFLSECGSWGPIQLLAQNPATGDTLRRSLEKPFAIIGRNPKADVPLQDEEVSHRHAYLQVYEGRVFCIDLKSRTGTHWDNGPQEYGWLEGKQTIRVGSYRLKLMAGGPGHPSETGGEPLVSRPVKNLALGGVSLEFMPRNGDPEVDEPLGRWKMQRALALVGRSPVCKVRLVHPSVSRIHCSLVQTPLGLWVIDLLGRKGTLVNGAPISWALLAEGDRLQIGKFLVRVRYDNSRRPESVRAKSPDTPAEFGDGETSEIDPPSNIILLSGSAPETSEAEGSRQNEDSFPVREPASDSAGPEADACGFARSEKRIEHREPPEASPVTYAPGSPLPTRNDQTSDVSEDLGNLSISEEGQSTEALDPRSSGPAVTDPCSPPRFGEAPKKEGGGALVRSSSHLPTKAELLESILPAITDQFAQMQQQMFDQFQQAMVMMFRTFGQLHREQMDLVRQELDRIHQLTQQLHALQMELAKHPAAASDPAVQEMLAALPPISPEAPRGLEAPLAADHAWQAALKAMIEDGGSKIETLSEPDESRSAILDPQFPALEAKERLAGAESSKPRHPEEHLGFAALSPGHPASEARMEDGGSKIEELSEPGDARSSNLDPQFSAAEEPPPEPEEPPSISPPDAGKRLRRGVKPTEAQANMTQDIHVLLCRQIAALQEERQSRWQRILTFLTGKPKREPMP